MAWRYIRHSDYGCDPPDVWVDRDNELERISKKFGGSGDDYLSLGDTWRNQPHDEWMPGRGQGPCESSCEPQHDSWWTGP